MADDVLIRIITEESGAKGGDSRATPGDSERPSRAEGSATRGEERDRRRQEQGDLRNRRNSDAVLRAMRASAGTGSAIPTAADFHGRLTKEPPVDKNRQRQNRRAAAAIRASRAAGRAGGGGRGVGRGRAFGRTVGRGVARAAGAGRFAGAAGAAGRVIGGAAAAGTISLSVLGVAAGGAVVALVAFGAVMLAVNRQAKKATEALKELHGGVAASVARREVANIQARLAQGARIGDDLAKLTDSKAQLDKAFIALQTAVLEPMLPHVQTIVDYFVRLASLVPGFDPAGKDVINDDIWKFLTDPAGFDEQAALDERAKRAAKGGILPPAFGVPSP